MNAVVIASTEADALAATSIEEHHAQLGGSLQLHVETVLAAAADARDGAWKDATERLASWCRAELLPHATAEEQTLYAAAHDTVEGRLLVDSMVREHVLIASLVAELTSSDEPLAAAAAAKALQVVISSHIEKENTLLLPLLSSAADVSLAALLDGMRERITGQDHEASPAQAGGHDCTCGETESTSYPELDARAVPHAIRHATVFGALDGIRPGGGMVLVAPHDPQPLLAQVERRNPGVFSVEYLERGPEAWRLSFVRVSA